MHYQVISHLCPPSDFVLYLVPSNLLDLDIVDYNLLLFRILGKGKEYWKEENINEEMPACRQMFNIFHPFDPVAYRSVFHTSD